MLILGHMHEAIGCMDYAKPIHEHLSPESNQLYIYINAKTE